VSTQKPETKIVNLLIGHLRDTGGYARKVHGNAYSSGEPDIDACVRGRAVKVEVKVPGRKPTAQQLARLRRWQEAQALAGWVTSLSELVELLDHLDDLDWQNPQLERGDW